MDSYTVLIRSFTTNISSSINHCNHLWLWVKKKIYILIISILINIFDTQRNRRSPNAIANSLSKDVMVSPKNLYAVLMPTIVQSHTRHKCEEKVDNTDNWTMISAFALTLFIVRTWPWLFWLFFSIFGQIMCLNFGLLGVVVYNMDMEDANIICSVPSLTYALLGKSPTSFNPTVYPPYMNLHPKTPEPAGTIIFQGGGHTCKLVFRCTLTKYHH